MGFPRFITQWFHRNQEKCILFDRNPQLSCYKTLEQIDFNKNHEIVKTMKYACCQRSKTVEIGELYHSNRRIWRQDFSFAFVRKMNPGWRRADSDTKNMKYYKKHKKHVTFDDIWEKDTYSTDLKNVKKCVLWIFWASVRDPTRCLNLIMIFKAKTRPFGNSLGIPYLCLIRLGSLALCQIAKCVIGLVTRSASPI